MSKELFHYYYKVPSEDDNCVEISDEIINIKIRVLNDLKKKIDVYYDPTRKYNIWNCMSRDLHPYESITSKLNIRCISRAFYKLLEILISFDEFHVVNSLRTLHLCEAPGGFIQACFFAYKDKIQDFLTVSVESCIKYHKDIKRHGIGTVLIGNICDDETSDQIFDACSDEGYPLITADGAFDVSENYENQEEATYELLFNEISIALSSQKQGGTFIIKIFDFLNTKTWNLIIWLRNCYDEVYICKPPSSRPVNSERYCVCKGFRNRYLYDFTIPKNSPEWLPNFRKIVVNSSLDYQISSLEKVFEHIGLLDTTHKSETAKQERIQTQKKGENDYLKVYGEYINQHSFQPQPFAFATPCQ